MARSSTIIFCCLLMASWQGFSMSEFSLSPAQCTRSKKRKRSESMDNGTRNCKKAKHFRASEKYEIFLVESVNKNESAARESKLKKKKLVFAQRVDLANFSRVKRIKRMRLNLEKSTKEIQVLVQIEFVSKAKRPMWLSFRKLEKILQSREYYQEYLCPYQEIEDLPGYDSSMTNLENHGKNNELDWQKYVSFKMGSKYLLTTENLVEAGYNFCQVKRCNKKKSDRFADTLDIPAFVSAEANEQVRK